MEQFAAYTCSKQESAESLKNGQKEKAIEKTDRSYEEIIAFLTGAATKEVV